MFSPGHSHTCSADEADPADPQPSLSAKIWIFMACSAFGSETSPGLPGRFCLNFAISFLLASVVALLTVVFGAQRGGDARVVHQRVHEVTTAGAASALRARPLRPSAGAGPCGRRRRRLLSCRQLLQRVRVPHLQQRKSRRQLQSQLHRLRALRSILLP